MIYSMFVPRSYLSVDMICQRDLMLFVKLSMLLYIGLHANPDIYEIYRSNCRRDALFKATDKNKILVGQNGSIISANYSESLAICAKRCLKIVQCRSYNYKRAADADTNNCMLLNITKNDTNAKLSAANGWAHYEPIAQIAPGCRRRPCSAGSTCHESCEKVSGRQCIDINECQSSPCHNGGRCDNLVNRYNCHCSGGDEGSRCEHKNIAYGKSTWQSSTFHYYYSRRAVDGYSYTSFGSGSCSHTLDEPEPWWKVDLGKTYPIKKVRITNRDMFADKLSNFDVRIGNNGTVAKSNPICRHVAGTIAASYTFTTYCPSGMSGRYVIVMLRGTSSLTLCEVKVFTPSNSQV